MKNGRGTLFPYLGDLGPKWKMDINFQVPDPIFKTKGLLDAESWEDCKNLKNNIFLKNGCGTLFPYLGHLG